MTNATSTQFTHNSYAEAMAQLKSNAKKRDASVVTWDAGDGYTGRGSYCAWRKRVVTETVTPSGAILH